MIQELENEWTMYLKRINVLIEYFSFDRDNLRHDLRQKVTN